MTTRPPAAASGAANDLAEDMPLRVAMLGPFGLRPKGTAAHRALPAARALAARGHAVTLIMPPWHTPEEAGRRWADPASGVVMAYVGLGGGPLAVALRLARSALAFRPDVVHAFKPKAYAGLAAAFLGLRPAGPRRPPIVMDADDWEGRGGWNDVEPYGRLVRAAFARQERWGLTHADHVTVASRALETLAWSLGVPPERVAYVPNALDDASAAPAPLAARPEPPAGRPPTLLLYTRFVEFAPERAVDILARVRARVPDARLLVAGRGLRGEEGRLLDRATAMGLADAIALHGWLEPADAERVFAAADVAILPFDDTLVNRTKSTAKLLELMAAGLPVVAEAVGQNREVLVDGVSGALVEPGDSEAFAGAVSDLLVDPARRTSLGDGARRRVAASFCWSRRVVELAAVYRRAIAAARGA